MPRDLQLALSGDGFRRKRRLVLPLLTTDPQGFPRVALLTLGAAAGVPTPANRAVWDILALYAEGGKPA